MKDELKPFWRSLCENLPLESDELLFNIKTKASLDFGIKPSEEKKEDEVNHFNGGLQMHNKE